MKKYFAEFLGTFCLVFAGTGAIIVNEISGGVITHLGIALTFGLIVMAMIYSLGEISGAHFNPAVTTAFFLARRFPLRELGPYVLAQCLGAILASMLLHLIFPQSVYLGATLPRILSPQAFLLEGLMSAFLVFVILSVSTGAKEKGITAGLAIGATVALDALFGGPVTGASMNPARSLGPALVSAHFEYLWIYLTAPFAGALLAVMNCRFVQGKSCCANTEVEGA